LSVLGPEQATQPHAFSLVQSRRVDGLMLAGRDISARFVLEPHASQQLTPKGEQLAPQPGLPGWTR